MIRRSLVLLVAFAAAFLVPASAVHATGYPPRPYPAVPVTMTVQDSTPRAGQTFWVRISGPEGKTARLTITRGGSSHVVYSSSRTITRHGTKSYAEFRVTLAKTGRHLLTGKVASVSNSTRTQVVTVRPAHPRWDWHHSNS